MTAVSEHTGAWLEQFTAQPQAGAPWIKELRETAFRRFVQLGFPTTKNEEWRFTNVAPIARVAWASRPVQPAGPHLAQAQQHLAQHASLDNPFVALNTAFLNDVKV